MDYKLVNKEFKTEITELFTRVFSESEGNEEGQLIGQLASELAEQIDSEDIIGFGAFEHDVLIGMIFFTSLRVEGSKVAYMLAPVAVVTNQQRKGVGQALIKQGLEELKSHAVDTVVTYGDPAFYSKVGFQSLSEEVLQAPLTLSMPEGWLGLSLSNKSISKVVGRTECVIPFNDPIYW